MSVTVGADPEFMLYDMDLENGIIPSIGIVPGTKENPHDFGDGTFCHEDNIAIEVGFDPCINDAQFVERLSLARANVQQNFLSRSQQLYICSAYNFSEEQLKPKQAQKFGCDLDFDAYTGGKMPRQVPRDMTEGTRRYAGGHIHIGGDFNCPPFVAALFADLFISLGGFVNGFERATTGLSNRRAFYGQPGVYREKPYGIEYRTPDNAWCYNKNSMRGTARSAFALGHFLENTSPTQIRILLKHLPWARIREVLAMPKRNGEMMNQLYYDVLNAGVAI